MVKTRLLENERVRLIDFTIELDDNTFIYEHPTVIWQVGDATFSVKENNIIRDFQTKDKQIFWVEPGTKWKLRNLGDSSLRFFIFEILQEKPKYTEEECEEMLKKCIYSTEVGTEKLFENKWVRVWDFYYPPGEGDPSNIHQHTLDYIFTFVGEYKQTIHGYNPDGSLQFKSVDKEGDVYWSPTSNGGFMSDGKTVDKEARHSAKNPSEIISYSECLVELK